MGAAARQHQGTRTESHAASHRAPRTQGCQGCRLARHRAVNPRWAAQQGQRACVSGSPAYRARQAASGALSSFPLHGGPHHRTSKPPRSSHPPKSVLVTCCSPSHSFLLCRLPITATNSSERPSLPLPSTKSRGKSETSFRASLSATQHAAFRIWQSRASLSESTAPQLSTAVPNNPLYPIPAQHPAPSTAAIHPHRAACAASDHRH
ncbi:hypothetical protein C7974DRAFT_144861 [Boeremia exigua]|uniref:uncharacterized protein n=1 Tax=Boeremia exigua TaxID=749465 RepID=UPI001E8DDC93|nr:uncharacterized protein C7974DRAFT_144861 [Boeremia exigua]KAH6637612.1 hypothetical protein C7974DRAFT_144861 [Boeremia exigua]